MEFSGCFVFALIASVAPGLSNTVLTAVDAQVGALRGMPALIGAALGAGPIFTFAAAIGCFLWLIGGAAMKAPLQRQMIARLFNIALGLRLAASMIALT